MSCLQIHILGLCKMRWIGESDFYSDDVRIVDSGGETEQRDVAVVLDKRALHTVDKNWFEADRLLMVRLRDKLTVVVIVEVYMSSSDYDEEIGEMCEKLRRS